MTSSIDSGSQGSSTRPYLIRALHDWCTDNGFTPYLAVYVDQSVQVPLEYVKSNEIVLNVSFEATTQLQLGNEFIEFKARFGGVARDISVPVDHVIAIYARENGQGMAFPVPSSITAPTDLAGVDAPVDAEGEETAERASPLRLARAPKATSSKESAEGKGARDPGDESVGSSDDGEPTEPTPPSPGGARPSLRRVK